MNHMLSNFQSNQRERDRARKQYIIDLKNQVLEQVSRKKRQEEMIKQADSIFDQKVLRQREEMKRKFVGRRQMMSKTPILEQISESERHCNPERDSQRSPKHYRSYLYAPIRQLSSFLAKDFSKSQLYDSRPKLSFQSNANYMRMKKSLQQQKQKIIRFKTEVRQRSRGRLMRAANTALENLKHITVQMKTEPDQPTWMREARRGKKMKETAGSKGWMQIIKMNEVQY